MSQEFGNNVLGLVTQKGFYAYEYISDYEIFKEELLSKEKFYSPLTDRKLVTTNMNMFLMPGQNWNKNNERLSQLVFKMWRFTISQFVWNI